MIVYDDSVCIKQYLLMASIRRYLLLLMCLAIVAKELSICDEISGLLREKKIKEMEELV